MTPRQGSRFHQGVIPASECAKLFESCRNADIIYRSGLELKFIRWCESSPRVLRWASEPFRIEYMSRLRTRLQPIPSRQGGGGTLRGHTPAARRRVLPLRHRLGHDFLNDRRAKPRKRPALHHTARDKTPKLRLHAKLHHSQPPRPRHTGSMDRELAPWRAFPLHQSQCRHRRSAERLARYPCRRRLS